MSIYEKLLKVQGEVGAISKDSKNPFYNSKYFDINKLIEVVKPVLQKHGILLMQPVLDGKVTTILHDVESGIEVISEIELTIKGEPQKSGIEVTYYRRYTLQSLLALQAEDDDANGTVVKQEQGKQQDKEKPWLNTNSPIFSKAIEKLKSGETTIDKIKQHYKLSKKVEEELLNVK